MTDTANEGTQLTLARDHWVKRCEAEKKAAEYKRQLEEESISKELINAMAEEIGRNTVAYVEVMYPEAIKATSSTFKLSLRNHIHNQIVSYAELHNEAAVRDRLIKDVAFRKEWVGMYRKMRRAK